MSIQTVETFEHDIADEIKSKEASAATIASSSGMIGNAPEEEPQSSKTFLILGGLVLLILIGGAGAYYALVLNKDTTTPQVVQPTPEQLTSFGTYFPQLQETLGGYIEKTEKRDAGYIITLTSYNQVFGHIIKNELQFFGDISSALSFVPDTSTSSEQTVTDLTRANQNMRVWQKGSSTLIYAFVDTSHLILAKTVEEVLLLRSSIIK